jgi:hypothetical protein
MDAIGRLIGDELKGHHLDLGKVCHVILLKEVELVVGLQTDEGIPA